METSVDIFYTDSMEAIPSAAGMSVEAVVCEAPRQIAIRSVRLPDPGPGDVLIRVASSGVSPGTDRWVLQGVFVWRDIRYPAIPGYQASGRIEWVGSSVQGLRVGQEVATIAGSAGPDAGSAWGTYASRVVASAADVYDATGIPPERAAFLVSAQVGYNGASRLLLPAASRVVVIGDGIIGASAALACAARGFDVLVIGRRTARMRSLESLGLATSSATDAEHAIRDHGTVAVIDTAQNEEAFAAYIDILPRATGQLVYSGHSPAGATAWGDMAALQKREITVHFVAGMLPHRLRATLDLMRTGALPVDRLASRIANDAASTQALLEDVAAGTLEPVAAAVDWSWAG